MTENTPAPATQCAVDDIIDAHGLDHRRAMALQKIVFAPGDVLFDVEGALYHLRRLRDHAGLRANAATALSADPDLATRMTPEAIAAVYGITDNFIREALVSIIPDHREFGSIITLTNDLDRGIAALEGYLDAQADEAVYGSTDNDDAEDGQS